ncbi:MAG: monofunctional biosynthetic peptidoglycan transglycosylase [Deltaproteobacteria bacterium]|nr:monofunctional biosynthetic peptidoglycan transglycosylase [Deltaproteobacteria bacterium]
MRALRVVLRWGARLGIGFVAASLAVVTLYHWVDPPMTPLMLLRVVEGALAGAPVGIDRRRVALRDVSPALVRAVIAAEDGRFFAHWGVDTTELERALEHDGLRNGRRLRGASTITMQCARSVFLWPGRSWIRKGIEVWLALLMEQLWGKRRILEVYLNVVEWGPGIYGAESAARRHFGMAAARLDAERAALLAAALPAPRRFDPAAPSPALRRRAATIMTRARAVELSVLPRLGAPRASGR